MLPLEDNTHYITTATGSIDYAYYDRQARISRSLTFKGFFNALKGIFSRPRLRLSIPAASLGCGPVASPCS